MAEKKKKSTGVGGPHGSYLVRKEKQKSRLDKAFNHSKPKPKKKGK